jgi:hypothetical protein
MVDSAKPEWKKWCPNCEYWRPLKVDALEEENAHGECRRHAPGPKWHEDCKNTNIYDEDNDGCLAVWPVTSFDQWCGEFKEKIE